LFHIADDGAQKMNDQEAKGTHPVVRELERRISQSIGNTEVEKAVLRNGGGAPHAGGSLKDPAHGGAFSR